MTQIMCSPVRAETHHALYLERGYPFLASQHQIDNLEPSSQANVCVLENCSDQNGKTISAFFSAFSALPVKWPISDGINIDVSTTRAVNTVRPTAIDQVLLAGIVSREQRLELRDSHLRSELRLVFAGHDRLPRINEGIMA